MKIEKRKDLLLYREVFPGNILAGITRYPVTGNEPRDKLTVLEALGLPLAGAAYLAQVHKAEVRAAERAGEYEGDGIFTGKGSLALFIRTADCLPLLFHSETDGVIGAVHMGWRSAEGGILENVPYVLDIFKVIAGPGMRKCCFEVGPEFRDKPRFKGLLEERGGHLFFDPVSFARECLVRRGLRPENFIDTGICSFCSEMDGLYSFRKTGTECRNLSFIVNK